MTTCVLPLTEPLVGLMLLIIGAAAAAIGVGATNRAEISSMAIHTRAGPINF